MTPTHANRGRMLEQLADAQHAIYAARNDAYILRALPGLRWDADGAHPAQVGMPDYVGILRSGYGCAFDAKQQARDRLSLSGDARHRARFTRQLGHLEAYSRAGGYGFLLVHLTGAGQTWVLPVRSMTTGWAAEWLAHSRASIGRVELDDIGIPVCAAGGPCDWLSALERW